MCGRFAQFTPGTKEQFEVVINDLPELPFRYNVAPTTKVKVVIEEDQRTLLLMRWGLQTEWSIKMKYPLINIRSDNLREKKTFHKMLHHTRCIIPADGFYEWKTLESGKEPYFIHPKSDLPFAFAGLWTRYQNEAGEVIKSCSIITTEPNSIMAKIHDRMPVILEKQYWNEWLAKDIEDHEKLISRLIPYPDELMESYPVSKAVNSIKNESVKLIEPIGVGGEDGKLL